MRWFVVFLLLRAWAGLVWAVQIPPWEASDEPFHYQYIARLAEFGEYPTTSNPMHIQPPLYYLISAAFVRLTGHTSRISAFVPPQNPYFRSGDGGINFTFRTRTPDGERQRAEATLVTLRWMTVLMSLLTCALFWRIAKLPALLFIFLPQFLFSTSTITNDSLAALWGVVLLWSMLRAQRRASTGRIFTLMLLCLVAVFIKLSLVPLILVALSLIWLTVPLKLRLISLILGCAAIGLAILLLSSASHILIPFVDEVGGRPAWETLLYRLREGRFDLIGESLRYGIESLPVRLGWGNVPLPTWISFGWWLMVGIGVFASFWRGGVSAEGTPNDHPLLCQIALVAVAAGVMLSVLYSNITLLNGRYLLPALSALMLLVLLGYRRLGRWGRQILALGMLGTIMLSITLPHQIAKLYRQPTAVAATDIPTMQPHRVVSNIELVAYKVQPSAQRGEDVEITVFWRAVRPIARFYSLRLEFIGPDGGGYGMYQTVFGNGTYPTTEWRVHETFRDIYRLPIRRDFPAPAIGYVKITLVEAGASLLLEDGPVNVRP